MPENCPARLRAPDILTLTLPQTSNNSFSGSHGDQPYGRETKSAAVNLRSHRAELDGEFYASAVQFRQQHGLRRLKSCSGLRCLDQGLLLVIISAGLFAILMGMCCLENWLRMNPDGLDRWLPRQFRSTRVRRVQHVSVSPRVFQEPKALEYSKDGDTRADTWQ